MPRERLPEFITFTGADDPDDIPGLIVLTERYPVEWGILFTANETRRGTPRYPRTPEHFLGCRLPLAAHLCGAYGRAVMAGDFGKLPGCLSSFRRVQVNHPAPNRHVAELQAWLRRPCVAQTQRPFEFPEVLGISWLFDASGGAGRLPPHWPAHPGRERIVGYAGGIGPENVREVIAAIGATGPYWIDMESGVRTDDRFDLAKVSAVCETVYGPAAAAEAPRA